MTEKNIKNIIFDVDGTLWDTTEIVAKAWNEAINGRSSVVVTADRLKQLFGKPMNVIGDELLYDIDSQMRAQILEECCVLEHEAVLENKEDITYPGMADTMKKLAREQGKRLFIVSNCQKGYIELFLEKTNLTEYVDDIECFGNNGLQKGENIALLMERNSLDKAETVYVGDIQGDMESAKFAGIDFVHAAYGFGKVTEYYKRIESFLELLSL